MPRIAPLDKLVHKARRLRDDHKERHRPSGFGFALADRVDYLDPVRWDALTAQSSMFLSRRYLRVLEEDCAATAATGSSPLSHHDEAPERNPFK